jgi:hypothetical protein
VNGFICGDPFMEVPYTGAGYRENWSCLRRPRS